MRDDTRPRSVPDPGQGGQSQGATGDHTSALCGNIQAGDTVQELAPPWGEGPCGWRGSRAVLSRLLAAFATLALLAPLPARAKSEKSRVVQKALVESVRVEVTVAGKVARAATGVVVANDAGSSFILTNEHVISRAGLKGTPSYTVIVERPALRRLPARVRFEADHPAEDLAVL